MSIETCETRDLIACVAIRILIQTNITKGIGIVILIMSIGASSRARKRPWL
jgi:hypothetical protein